VKKSIASLSISQSARTRQILERGSLFETELLWGPKNKKQSQLREPWDTSATRSEWEMSQETVMEKGKPQTQIH
jgi:hypothetical protein